MFKVMEKGLQLIVTLFCQKRMQCSGLAAILKQECSHSGKADLDELL